VRKLIAVAKREFKAATANKTFIIMTILGPFFIFAVTVLPTLLTSNPKAMNSGKPIAIHSATETGSSAVAGAGTMLAESLSEQGLPVIRVKGLQEAKELVLGGDYAGLVELPSGWPNQEARYYTKTGTEATVYGNIQAVLGAYATQLRIHEAGLSPEQASALLSKPRFRVVKLGADQSEETRTQDDFLGVLLTAIAFVMVIYMTVLLYGQMIGRSVVQEKTNKTVEIMLSSLSTRQLLFGKIFGLGLAGLLQYAVWVSMGVVMVSIAGPAFGLSLPAAVSVDSFVWLVVFFVLAFFLYASIYASLGAAAEDEHHMNQLAWPVSLFLLVPMILISTIIMNPESPVALALSFFPMTSPIVMLVRILVAQPSAWELVLCIVLLMASIYATIVLGARIFRVGILMSGKRSGFREILRWVRVR
jgi:ABC-2 type transport system permease protein